jgi:hypothetical protein
MVGLSRLESKGIPFHKQRIMMITNVIHDIILNTPSDEIQLCNSRMNFL